jgi:hypothetical protein
MMWLTHLVLAASVAVPSPSALDPAPFGRTVTPGLRFINACLADAEFEPQDGLLAAAVAALQDPQVAQTQGDAGADAPVPDGLERPDELIGFDSLKRGAFVPEVGAEEYVGDTLTTSEHRSEDLVEVIVLSGVDLVLERWSA